MSGGTGSLIIKPSAARLTRDTEFLGKMDPYCVVKMGSQKQRTATHQSAGKFPSWRDSIVFRRTHEDMVTFEVWDADTASSDDLVGEGNLPIHSVLTSGNFNDWVNLTYKGKSSGQLRVDIQWVPDQGAKAHNPAQHQPYQQVPQQSPITPTLIIQQLPGYVANAYPPQYAAPYAGPPAGYAPAPAPAYPSPYGQYADPSMYLTPQAMQNVPGYSYPYPQQPQGYPQGYPGYPQGYYYPPR
jgi:hypothetical protein